MMNPFKNNKNENDYHYFDIARITRNCDFSSFAQGEEIYKSQKASLVKLESFYYNGVNCGTAVISIKSGEKDNYSVKLTFNSEKLLEAICECKECSAFYWKYHGIQPNKLCASKCAALLVLRDALKVYNIGDHTSQKAMTLINSLKIPSHNDASLHLIPRLNFDDYNNSFSLSLKLDNGKKVYVVPDIDRMLICKQGNGQLTLGTKTVIDFGEQHFDDKSEKFLKCIQKWRNNDANHYMQEHQWGRPNIITYGKEIQLFGARYDDIFEIGNELNFVIDKDELTFTDKMPKLRFTLNELTRDKTFEGVKLCGKLNQNFFDSVSNLYFFNDKKNEFCRIPKDKEDILRFFLTAVNAQKNNTFELTVGRRQLASFYEQTLPAIKQIAEIDEPDKQTVEKFIPPPPEFSFFLDKKENSIFCTSTVKYGNAEFNPYISSYATVLPETVRDLKKEKSAMLTVKKYFPVADDQNSSFFASDEDDIYHFLDEGAEELMQLGEVQYTPALRSLTIRRTPNVQIGVSVESNLLELDISSELSQQELLNIISTYRQKKKYYRLKNGDFMNIDDTAGELSMMLEAMHITPKEFVKGKMQIPAYRALYLDKMLEDCESIYAKRNSHYKELVKSFKTVRDSDFEVPAGMPVRNYQNYGCKWLRTLAASGFGGILADDMGLGKTLQMIAAIQGSMEAGEKGKSLVICPASLVFNWQEEFAKFAPGISVKLLVGKPEERKAALEENADVFITSYDLIKRDTDAYEGKSFLFEVLDEAQFIKNHNTTAAKAVKIIQAKHRFALTGTPIENRLSELWSIFDYLMPGFLYGYETFKKELETPIAKRNDSDAKKRLCRMTAPFILRRLKSEVLKDLPDKMEETWYSQFDEEQKNVYDGDVTRLKQKLEKESSEGFQKGKLEILTELTRLREICCDPSLVFENYSGGSAKLDTCMELVQRAIDGDHRILIFSQFTSMLERIEARLNEAGIEFYKIIGSTPKQNRLSLVHDFNEGNIPVFLISLKAGEQVLISQVQML